MENTWLKQAKRLQAIASTGLHYCEEPFDRERYEEIAAISNGLLAALGGVPVERIEGLVPDFAQGYSTPRMDVRGAVFRGDEVLLVREKSDGLWTLPGGFADVGKSAAENVVEEIWEEANVRVEATALYAFKHKAKHGYDPDVRDFYKAFFVCSPVAALEPRPGPEVSDAAFFGLQSLPPLSTDRVLEQDIVTAFDFRHGRLVAPLFD